MSDAWGFPHSAFLVECDGTPVISQTPRRQVVKTPLFPWSVNREQD